MDENFSTDDFKVIDKTVIKNQEHEQNDLNPVSLQPQPKIILEKSESVL